MNLVFLTSEAIHQWYLINRIHQEHGVRKVFYQRPLPTGTRWTRRFRKLASPHALRMYARETAAAILFLQERRRQATYEQRMFFGNRQPALDPAIPHTFVDSFNTPAAVEQIRREEPDLLVVFGTGILKSDILSIARVDILNIHRGIAPKYRGAGLPDWVLYNQDFNNLGVTIHQCAAKLDAGDILAQRHYQLQPDDRIYTLRYKTTCLAAELLSETIQAFSEHAVQYNAQPEEAQTYTARELTLSKQIAARRHLKTYLQKLQSVRS